MKPSGALSPARELFRQRLAHAEGKTAKIEYVMQKLRRDSLHQGDQKQVLRVLVKS